MSPFNSNSPSNPRFGRILAEMQHLHEKKSLDYARVTGTGSPDFYTNFTCAAGIAKIFDDPMDRVFATLIGIKLARLAELTRTGHEGAPANEAIRDTRIDLANYAAIWASYFEDAAVPIATHPVEPPRTIELSPFAIQHKGGGFK